MLELIKRSSGTQVQYIHVISVRMNFHHLPFFNTIFGAKIIIGAAGAIDLYVLQQLLVMVEHIKLILIYHCATCDECKELNFLCIFGNILLHQLPAS